MHGPVHSSVWQRGCCHSDDRFHACYFVSGTYSFPSLISDACHVFLRAGRSSTLGSPLLRPRRGIPRPLILSSHLFTTGVWVHVGFSSVDSGGVKIRHFFPSQVLTQLLLYYTRFQEIIRKSWRRPPAFTKDLVSTSAILKEIKTYSRSY